MARIGDTERLIWEQHATITDLRARLAEVEAERDYWQDISAGNENVAANFRARLEAAEAERDELRDEIGNLTMHDAAVEWRKTEAKLARVEATLCSAMCPCCEDIRAALRQEDGRGE